MKSSKGNSTEMTDCSFRVVAMARGDYVLTTQRNGKGSRRHHGITVMLVNLKTGPLNRADAREPAAAAAAAAAAIPHGGGRQRDQ